MKLLHTRWTAAAGVALLALAAGCQKEDPATKERLDKILAKLDDLEKKVDRVGTGRPGAQAPGPQPGRPDPTTVYSVPVDGSPSKGPATAKVTIIEAAEFA
jgi:hypothetical protein